LVTFTEIVTVFLPVESVAGKANLSLLSHQIFVILFGENDKNIATFGRFRGRQNY
jgi:hypothetical protein